MEQLKPSAKKLLFRMAWPFFFAFMVFGKALYNLGLSYKFQMDWGSYPNPEWFDHEYDLAFFPKWRKAHFFERGVYLQEVLQPQDSVLDLCCGDGSVTALFISPKVERVVGIDFDVNAINQASSKFANVKNASFQVGDIRNLSFPDRQFDVVTWDAAIEHFTQEEMNRIFHSIRTVLKETGFLAGSTVAEQAHVQHHDHEFEFESVGQLDSFLKKYFKNVLVWERQHADRKNFYFRCSDANLSLNTRSRN